MRALANDGQPRFRLPCAEVLLPSCASPVAAPGLRRQILVLLFGAAVTGCAGPRPQLRPQDQTGSHRIEFGIAQRLPEVRLVQRARVISPRLWKRCLLTESIPAASTWKASLHCGYTDETPTLPGSGRVTGKPDTIQKCLQSGTLSSSLSASGISRQSRCPHHSGGTVGWKSV